jgi:glutamate-1-semialdehyde 2,1-aminomutase
MAGTRRPGRKNSALVSAETHPDGLSERAHRLIPGGCHTYSKGDDQFPALAPPFIARGDGCHAFDPDGRKYLDWGMGLRTVILGHAYPRVTEAAIAELRNGTNFTRPSLLEVEFAEELVDLIPCAEMVKFAKNGSDVTTAAVRLARAATGRDLVAFPREQPFLSVDDWFIGATEMNSGVPEAIRRISLTFTYGDARSLEQLFEQYPDTIAAVIMEAATTSPPPPGYLERVRELTTARGAVLVFDEMITGFRWDLRGAQRHFGVTPDLATFGKALANGFAVSALTGRRDVMELGGTGHAKERVFLLSTTHGGETHSLAAARATVAELREREVAEHLWTVGQRLCDGLNGAARDGHVADAFSAVGFPCSPVLMFDGQASVSNAELRTLFLQEMVAQGILIPYVAPSLSHGLAEVDRTVEAATAAFTLIRRVLDGEPIEQHLVGPPVKPVFRRYNFDR